jgi:hypothetical protein
MSGSIYRVIDWARLCPTGRLTGSEQADATRLTVGLRRVESGRVASSRVAFGSSETCHNVLTD